MTCSHCDHLLSLKSSGRTAACCMHAEGPSSSSNAFDQLHFTNLLHVSLTNYSTTEMHTVKVSSHQNCCQTPLNQLDDGYHNASITTCALLIKSFCQKRLYQLNNWILPGMHWHPRQPCEQSGIRVVHSVVLIISCIHRRQTTDQLETITSMPCLPYVKTG